MRRRLLSSAMLVFTAACGEGGGGEGGAGDAGGAGGGGAPVEATCDPVKKRAVLEGEFECAGAPETVSVQGRYRYEIFKYEASHPLATEGLAFPCAVSKGEVYEAPQQPTPACSRAGVEPWHSVRWEDADRACKKVGDGWRLCTGDELLRACAGPDDNAYTYGGRFETGACNVLQNYSEAGEHRAAPTGAYARCVSEEGAFDLTGNLWEWTDDRENNDPSTRVFQGAGWRIIAERHRESDQTCDQRNLLPGLSARSYANPDVGFRCCRTASGG